MSKIGDTRSFAGRNAKCPLSVDGWWPSDRRAALVIVGSSQRRLQQMLQLLRGAVAGVLKGCGFVAYGHRLSAGWSSFHQASLVRAAGFCAGLVAEMDLHPGYLIGELAQRRAHLGLDVVREFFDVLRRCGPC